MNPFKNLKEKIEMSIIQKIIASLIERVFKNYLTSIIGVLVVVSATLGGMAQAISETLVFHGIHIQSTLVTAAAVILGIAGILAKDTNTKLPPKVGVVLIALLLGASTLNAQSSSSASTPQTLPTNVYSFGVSYNNGTTPSVAGTAFYARLANSTSGTYGFTVLDILPTSLKPTVVTTNIGVGVSQKVLTVNNINFFVPVSTGLTVTGTNSGWNWTGGGLMDYTIKKGGLPTQYHIEPNVRFVKSTVSNGSGYQLIFGLNFAIGQ